MASDNFAGVTAIESRTAAVTVNVVLPDTVLPPTVKLAVMVEVPAATVVARPVRAPIVAFVRSELDQVTSVVKSTVGPAVKVPVAVNCWVRPATTEGLAGVTAMDVNAAAVTVSVLVAVIVAVPTVMLAVITVEPPATVVATPVLELMVATPGVALDQVTPLVRAVVLVGEVVLMAVKVMLLPRGI